MISPGIAREIAAHAAAGLPLAAAPSFGVLSLLTASGMPDMLCLHGGSPLGGMSFMYGLMAAFHAGPWLRLISRRPSRP